MRKALGSLAVLAALGAPCTAMAQGGSARFAAAEVSSEAHGLESQSWKQEKTSEAPALAAARRLRNARTGSAKNITP